MSSDRATALEAAQVGLTGRLALRGVRAVVGGGVLDEATVVCDGGVIVEVREGRAAPREAIDGSGLFCLPGLVDLHDDGLEKEIRPRATVAFPLDFALRSFEGRLRAAGVTTAFHGVAFDDNPAYHRSAALAEELCDTIAERNATGAAPVDHRVLHRLEARSAEGLDALARRLPHPARGGPAPLVSFEDHAPGRGQYRNVATFAASIAPEQVPDGRTVDEYVAEVTARAADRAEVRTQSLAVLSEWARSGAVTLCAHDCEDAADVASAHDHGAHIAEFPLGLDAARAARKLGMPVVMGAPNVVRGGSHSGNVAAEQLVASGLCDVLASDYQPAALLAAVFRLAEPGSVPLHQAVALVTANPAAAVGLADRGRLEPGARADVTLVEYDGRWPRVRAVWRTETS